MCTTLLPSCGVTWWRGPATLAPGNAAVADFTASMSQYELLRLAQGSYPAASLVKVVTAAAGLGHDPKQTRRPCLYTGNQYRLTHSSVRRPKRGHSVSLEQALASSNNRCFAQLAVETLGDEVLLAALERFGGTSSPAPGHAAGELHRGDGDYDLGRLGSGLAQTRITPLHAGQLAAGRVSGMAAGEAGAGRGPPGVGRWGRVTRLLPAAAHGLV